MNTKPTNLAPCLSDALIALGEQPNGPKVTNVTVGTAVKLSKSTGYRILDREWDGQLEQIAHAVEHSPLAPAFIDAIFGGSTKYRVVPVDEATRVNGDFNRDGRVDAKDIWEGSLASLTSVTETMRATQVSEGNGCISPQEAARIKAECLKAIEALSHVMTATKVLTLSGKGMRVAG